MLIELRNISKTYKNGMNDKKVLNNIDLDIEKKELLAICGVSGSGKSTLLSIIGCSLLNYSGIYKYDNVVIESNDQIQSDFRRTKVGFIPQDNLLIQDLTVEKNITLPLRLESNKSIKREKIKKLDNLLLEFGILDKKKSYVSNLSGGEKQRVAICRALITEPEIILADEPSAALDDENSNILMDFFEKLRIKGKTVIIVTHDERVYKRCSRVLRLHNGNIID